MQQGPPRWRRARPVADAPIEALLRRSEDLTKGWLLALLERAALEQAPSILAADLAREGPPLCNALVRALADDAELLLIEPGGTLEPLVSQAGELAGAEGAEASSSAVDALGAVIWSGLRQELAGPDPDQVAELAERLALVIALVRGAALRRLERGAGVGPGTGVGPRAGAGPRAGVGPGTGPPWIAAVEAEILRSERSGASLSLLLVELADADRLLAVETGSDAAAALGGFAGAVRSVVRRHDVLARESDTRAWIIARDTGRLGAEALGSRIVSAVRAARPWRGAPMLVNIGLAVLGEDGQDCASLAETAEEARFAAAASGIGIARGTANEHAGGPPEGSGPKLVS